MSETIRTGGCLCGAVRFEVRGEPNRVGLCHCSDCRKESGSVVVTYAIWPRQSFSFTGAVTTYAGRSFCPRCGSRLFNLTEEKAEIRCGSLDNAPTGFMPEVEGWTKRREAWLHPLPGVFQASEDP